MKNFDLEPFDEETKILLQYVNDNFLIDTVEKVEFISQIGGHEIVTYNIKKLYIAKNLIISDNSDNNVLTYIRFYDNADLIKFEICNPSVYWDNLLNIQKYLTNYFTIKNILFSRLDNQAYNRFKMLGYRIILQ